MYKKHKALKQSFGEDLASHETLVETHGKLKEAHSSLLALKKKPIGITSIGVSCDIIDDSIHAPIIIALTKNLSSMGKNTANTLLNLENETLKGGKQAQLRPE